MSNWLSVKDFPNIPNRATLQLIRPAMRGSDDHLTYEQRIFVEPAGSVHYKITHWMPLPEEPEILNDEN